MAIAYGKVTEKNMEFYSYRPRQPSSHLGIKKLFFCCFIVALMPFDEIGQRFPTFFKSKSISFAEGIVSRLDLPHLKAPFILPLEIPKLLQDPQTMPRGTPIFFGVQQDAVFDVSISVKVSSTRSANDARPGLSIFPISFGTHYLRRILSAVFSSPLTPSESNFVSRERPNCHSNGTDTVTSYTGKDNNKPVLHNSKTAMTKPPQPTWPHQTLFSSFQYTQHVQLPQRLKTVDDAKTGKESTNESLNSDYHSSAALNVKDKNLSSVEPLNSKRHPCTATDYFSATSNNVQSIERDMLSTSTGCINTTAKNDALSESKESNIYGTFLFNKLKNFVQNLCHVASKSSLLPIFNGIKIHLKEPKKGEKKANLFTMASTRGKRFDGQGRQSLHERGMVGKWWSWNNRISGKDDFLDDGEMAKLAAQRRNVGGARGRRTIDYCRGGDNVSGSDGSGGSGSSGSGGGSDCNGGSGIMGCTSTYFRFNEPSYNDSAGMNSTSNVRAEKCLTALKDLSNNSADSNIVGRRLGEEAAIDFSGDLHLFVVTYRQLVRSGYGIMLRRGFMNIQNDFVWHAQFESYLKIPLGRETRLHHKFPISDELFVFIINRHNFPIDMTGSISLVNPGGKHLSATQFWEGPSAFVMSSIYFAMSIGLLVLLVAEWNPEKRTPLHALMLMAAVVKTTYLFLDFKNAENFNLTGEVYQWHWMLPWMLCKLEDILILMLFLLLALGWRVFRHSLTQVEGRLCSALCLMSFYLGVFEVSMGGFQASRYIIHAMTCLVIVAVTFDVTILTTHLSELGISLTTGESYQKLKSYCVFRWILVFYIIKPTILLMYKITVLDAVSQDANDTTYDWMILSVDDFLDFCILTSVVYAFRNVKPFRVFKVLLPSGAATEEADDGNDGNIVDEDTFPPPQHSDLNE